MHPKYDRQLYGVLNSKSECLALPVSSERDISKDTYVKAHLNSSVFNPHLNVSRFWPP